ncbi:hypothetical protein BDF20DRAFT_879031 [Mycotypha africana]|uniref:uncharacterized protein n=1 Tax=Mycotypha africana TaxID=64632 RepID=UPI002301D060|nr:uncharacterized protein BDF20DRAFT_879031 [Mycotypha africana]KAI8975493.1 hypothetical protein BDF20DRAFT_879031 [Mycotypha africana]
MHIPMNTPSISEASTASSVLATPAEDLLMNDLTDSEMPFMLQQPSFTKPIASTSNDSAAGVESFSPIARPPTPQLGMTLSHYDASTGSYMSSQLNSNYEVKSPICTGMIPVYRPPFERWGSCLI